MEWVKVSDWIQALQIDILVNILALEIIFKRPK